VEPLRDVWFCSDCPVVAFERRASSGQPIPRPQGTGSVDRPSLPPRRLEDSSGTPSDPGLPCERHVVAPRVVDDLGLAASPSACRFDNPARRHRPLTSPPQIGERGSPRVGGRSSEGSPIASSIQLRSGHERPGVEGHSGVHHGAERELRRDSVRAVNHRIATVAQRLEDHAASARNVAIPGATKPWLP
jgi:hypothetical protein